MEPAFEDLFFIVVPMEVYTQWTTINM